MSYRRMELLKIVTDPQKTSFVEGLSEADIYTEIVIGHVGEDGIIVPVEDV